jgi:hypothetical protein
VASRSANWARPSIMIYIITISETVKLLQDFNVVVAVPVVARIG